MKTVIGLIPSGVLDAPDDPLADSLGTAPERLGNGCGCDRPRWSVRPCGHCACASECNDCPANKLWRDELESWCGCAKPGQDGVLGCGHCSPVGTDASRRSGTGRMHPCRSCPVPDD